MNATLYFFNSSVKKQFSANNQLPEFYLMSAQLEIPCRVGDEKPNKELKMLIGAEIRVIVLISLLHLISLFSPMLEEDTVHVGIDSGEVLRKG